MERTLSDVECPLDRTIRFNAGVALGQLAFIAAVLVVLRLARCIALAPAAERFARRATSYAIGTLAAFRFCERLAGFVS